MRWRLSLTITALGLALVSCAAPDTTIGGEIRDTGISLEQQTAPHNVWVELHNVGSAPCELVAVLTALPPDALPVNEGRVVLGLSGAVDEAYPMEVYIEIDGQPAGGEGRGPEGAHAVVQPGETARIQMALTGTPEREERILICNAPGDYEDGRYAVLRFDRSG